MSCLLIIEEKYYVMWLAQGENYRGVITIINKFHTDTHQQAKTMLIFRFMILVLGFIFPR
jgi:hypothetical protein